MATTQHPPADPIDLAAIRWYICSLEQLAIQAYMKKRANYAAIEAILQGARQSLHDLRVVGATGSKQGDEVAPPKARAMAFDASSGDGDDCPWTICEDGSCRPKCDLIT